MQNFTSLLLQQLDQGDITFQEAQKQISIYQPSTLLERKQFIQIKKKIDILEKEYMRDNAIKNLEKYVLRLRTLIDQSRNALPKERFNILQQANELKEMTEAMIYILEKFQDPLSQKFVTDSKRVILEYEEEKMSSFILVQNEQNTSIKSENKFSSIQKSQQKEILQQTKRQKLRNILERLLNCSCNQEIDNEIRSNMNSRVSKYHYQI